MMAGVSEQIHDIGKRRAWVIWLVSLSVYLLAVFNRSSLGVAGLLAQDRFGISAAQLSFFVVLQLVVYAGLQIPIGVLLDRYGSRALLLAGLALMSAGQLVFAYATSFPVAVLARAVLGAGDATVFVSVIRLVALWFLVRQAPLVTQLTGQVGQVGAIIAAAPLAFALDQLGWTKTFALASSLGVLLMVAVALGVKDSPYRSEGPVRIKMRALRRTLSLVWGNPGTRLGMWSHFTSQFSATVFALLWGFPFLVKGEGLSGGAASTLLMVMTGWVIISGLVLGTLVARYPYYRSWLVLVIVARDGARVGGRPGQVDAGADVDAGGAGLPDGDRRAGVDGRLRPGPHVHPEGGVRAGQRLRQRGRLLGQPADDGVHRRSCSTGQRRWRVRVVRPRRLPGRDVGAVRVLGLRRRA